MLKHPGRDWSQSLRGEHVRIEEIFVNRYQTCLRTVAKMLDMFSAVMTNGDWLTTCLLDTEHRTMYCQWAFQCEINTECWSNQNMWTIIQQCILKVVLKVLLCLCVDHLRPKPRWSSPLCYISSNRRTWFKNIWGKTSLIPVFSRSSFHLEWTHMAHFSSSIVLSLLYLEAHVGLFVLTAVFI